MGSSFHRLVMAAMAAGLLVIPGCGAADGKSPTGSSTTQDPPVQTASAQPTIVSASIENGNTLKVSFSNPIAPADGVDPAKFRLTMGYYKAPSYAKGYYGSKYAGGTYTGGKYTYTGGTKGTSNGNKTYAYAGGTYAGGKYYGNGYKYGGYGAPDHTVYSDVAPIASIKVDPSVATFAELPLGATFDLATTCQEIAAHNQANSNAHAGLYLHYTSSGSPTLKDTQGNPVASLAAYWSTDPTIEQVGGDFVGKPIPVSITCP